MAKAEVDINCGGEQHRIQLTDKGRLRLCNHPRQFWKTMEMHKALGMKCGCMSALHAWRRGDCTNVDNILPFADQHRWNPKRFRAMGTLLPDGNIVRCGCDLLTLPLHERLRRRAQREATLALRTCRYNRLSWSHHKALVRVAMTHTQEPVQCEGGFDNHGPGLATKAESWWNITIRLSWLTRVHAIGLATVEGRFVLNAEPYTEQIWKITYGRQGRGYRLRKAHGFAVRHQNGRFTLARHKGQVHAYLTALSRPCLLDFSLDKRDEPGITSVTQPTDERG